MGNDRDRVVVVNQGGGFSHGVGIGCGIYSGMMLAAGLALFVGAVVVVLFCAGIIGAASKIPPPSTTPPQQVLVPAPRSTPTVRIPASPTPPPAVTHEPPELAVAAGAGSAKPGDSPPSLFETTPPKPVAPPSPFSVALSDVKPAPKDLVPVGLVLNWYPEPQFGGFFAADINGIYAKHGLKVTIRSGGPDVNSLSTTEASKKLDFRVVVADEVVGLRAQGLDVVAVFASFQTNPQGIMVHESRGINSIEELISTGGTIAVQDALPYVKFFRKKYDMSKVRLVSYTGEFAKFRDDPQYAQQCFATSETIAAKQAGLKPKSFLIAESGFNPYATVVIARGQMLKENRDVVEKFVKATREGWEAYLTGPKPANTAMAKLNQAMDDPTFVASAEAQVPLVKDVFTEKEGIGAMSLERWRTLITQLTDLDVVPKDKAPKAEDCFVNIK